MRIAITIEIRRNPCTGCRQRSKVSKRLDRLEKRMKPASLYKMLCEILEKEFEQIKDMDYSS